MLSLPSPYAPGHGQGGGKQLGAFTAGLQVEPDPRHPLHHPSHACTELTPERGREDTWGSSLPQLTTTSTLGKQGQEAKLELQDLCPIPLCCVQLLAAPEQCWGLCDPQCHRQ